MVAMEVSQHHKRSAIEVTLALTSLTSDYLAHDSVKYLVLTLKGLGFRFGLGALCPII
jgi:hypothetical protein